jgi:hypothetical protein
MNVAGWRSIFSEGSVGLAVARPDRSVARKKMVLFARRCVTLHPGSISVKIAAALNRGSDRSAVGRAAVLSFLEFDFRAGGLPPSQERKTLGSVPLYA